MTEGVPAPGKAELDKAGWIVTAHMADDAVTAAKADTFLSGLITGVAGASPEVHGLGASPSMFFAMAQYCGAGVELDVGTPTADATNVYVTTATTDIKYLVFAWL